ncbi:MAG: chemotaxis protein CheW [Burkholderiales bacterium PBB1]|nr:MAG: chemotaxis protein CheW [Burkholderiales bacterium PBB1]
MADKEALRALQNRLAQRLQDARSTVRGRAWLAVECGRRGFLFPLQEAGEIFSMSPVAAVSHAQAWFLGVANLRGQLHGVVDLACFLGVGTSSEGRDQAMLVGFNTSLEMNAVLLVDRLAGLRGEDQLSAEPVDSPAASVPSFVGSRWRDASGRIWQEINLARLVKHPAFLKIVR